MNLTRRSKWLIGSAALVAGWVAFGPKEPDAVEPARASSVTTAHTSRPAAAANAVPAASLEKLRFERKAVGEQVVNADVGFVVFVRGEAQP